MTAAATRETVGNLARLVLDASRRHGGLALRVPDGDGWQETTFGELATIARELAAGPIALGVRPGDRVAILGDTRPEWTIADAGALCAGAVVVPVYRTSSPEECRYVLGHSGATAVICEGADQVAKVRGVAGDLPELAHVLAMEPVPGVESLDELRARGRAAGQDGVEHALGAVGPGDVATVVYTSGTTGPPKGCELTHANLLATVRMYEASLALDPDVVIFMFLPLAHALARVVELVALDVGATLSFWSRDPAKLVDDLARARPTHFPSVPRVFEKVHGLAIAAMEDASSLRRKIFHWSLDTGARVRAAERRGAAPGAALRARHRLADRLVLRHVRDLFGGALQLGLTGAAPIGREILEFFDACGVPILEGYGMTESCAAATLNTPRAMRLGSVGRPLPGCDVAIAADGEILVAGPMVFAGYRADGGATAKAVRDDWLLTGDLGSVDTDGFLSITGRKKGPDHHVERQEHHAVEHRDRAAGVPLDLGGGRVRRQPSVPRRTRDARRGRPGRARRARRHGARPGRARRGAWSAHRDPGGGRPR